MGSGGRKQGPWGSAAVSERTWWALEERRTGASSSSSRRGWPSCGRPRRWAGRGGVQIGCGRVQGQRQRDGR